MKPEIRAGIEQAKSLLDTKEKNVTARFAVVDSLGRVHLGGTACHGRLGSILDGSKNMREVIVTAIDQPEVGSASEKVQRSKAQTERYSHYLTKESVYSDIFLGIEDGYYLVDAHHPSNMVAAACVATRATWERYGGVSKLITTLVDAGVPPNLALFLGNSVTFSGSSLKMAWSRSIEDHHCLESNHFSFKCLRNLLDGTPKFLNKTYHESAPYQGINQTFLSYPLRDNYMRYTGTGSVQKWMGANMVDTPAASVSTNPFPVAVQTHADNRKWYSFEQGVAIAIREAPNLIKEVYK